MSTDLDSSRSHAQATDATTIVCCIEAGRVEKQTLVMLETLRRWGGPVGQSRVLAVIPRRGRRLSKATISRLDSFGVELHDGSSRNRMSWYNWYAKIVAARLAEDIATTPIVVWLDSDALVLGPLVELGLPHGDDFTARRDPLMPGLDVASPFLDYFRLACETVGANWEDTPLLPTDGGPSRLVFNAGVYAFRRGLGFSEAYEDSTARLIQGRIAPANGCFWYNEQTALLLAMMRTRMRFRELTQHENHMVFVELIDGEGAAPSIADARLVHYSRSMYPQYWARFMKRVERERPEHYDWLFRNGPIVRRKILSTPMDLSRNLYRKLYSGQYAKSCRHSVEAWKNRGAAPFRKSLNPI